MNREELMTQVYLSNRDNRCYLDGESIKWLEDKLTTPQLDSEVKEAIKYLVSRYMIIEGFAGYKQINTIKQHISNQQSKLDRIEEVVNRDIMKWSSGCILRDLKIFLKEGKQ